MVARSFRRVFPFLVLGALVVFVVISFSWGVGRASYRTGGTGAPQPWDELIKANAAKQKAAMQYLMAQMQPSDVERATLKRLERQVSAAELERAVARLDRKYEKLTLDQVPGIDRKLVNAKPAIMKDVLGRERVAFQKSVSAFDDLVGLVTQEATANCLIPFTFQALQIYGGITGPAISDVRQGMLGAGRQADGEYTLTNLGDTDGKGRVPIDGQLAIVFGAEIPQAGTYYLLMPSGLFFVNGSTRVKGHGNFTTCYDSKASVQMVQSLYAGETCLEYSGPWSIHSDGTRSEDRTKYFDKDIQYDSRFIQFYASGPCYLTLYYWLFGHTECNEDGKAWVTIDLFGFPANTKHDYDTLVVLSR